MRYVPGTAHVDSQHLSDQGAGVLREMRRIVARASIAETDVEIPVGSKNARWPPLWFANGCPMNNGRAGPDQIESTGRNKTRS